MAKRKIQDSTQEPTQDSADTDAVPATSGIKSDLPNIESPPLNPGSASIAAEPAEPAIEIAAPASDASPSTKPYFALTRRQKRTSMFAASLALAAGFGAAVGAFANGSFAAPPARSTDSIALEERKALQRSVAHLTKEISSLKASAAKANANANTHVAKITERFDRAAADDITGSIQAPATIPVPQPRPMQTAPSANAMQPIPPAKQPVVQGWSIRDFRDGNVYVEGRGEIFQVMPGAPLPGLGPVETIKRQEGRLMVVTPKGIIVSMRDRGYFEH